MTMALAQPIVPVPDFGAEIEQDLIAGLTEEYKIYGESARLTFGQATQLVEEYKQYWRDHKLNGDTRFTPPSPGLDRVHHRLQATYLNGASVYVEAVRDYFGRDFNLDHSTALCVSQAGGNKDDRAAA